MFQHRSSFAVPFTSFFLTEDDGKNPPVPPVKPDKPQFDDAQQKHINDLLAAERKNAEERTEQRVRDEQAEKDAKAKADADAQAAIERGEAQKVIAERDQAIADKDARITELEAKVAKAEEQAAKRVETLKAELPDEAMGGFPADAEATVQEAWLVERKDLVFKLAPATANANGHPRVPPTPPAQGQIKPEARSLISPRAI